ncbi:MAG TPA: TPM domain-containing protein [Prochlorococcaceae cyanobacterium AMR_MDS_5431]|nr:TPM domain-containing protein [Prochlorococcaceae cyanobacterium AMR_MDS_5431]
MSHLQRLSLPGTILVWGIINVSTVFAVGVQDFPVSLPKDLILDSANILSRSTSSELTHRLESFAEGSVNARLITLKQLDYNTTLNQLGHSLIDHWTSDSNHENERLLLILLETQTNNAAIVVNKGLEEPLTNDLLDSTARLTMGIPLREGERYRQASLSAIDRLEAVLNGNEDPGAPIQDEVITLTSNIPTEEETAASNAFTWIVALLVVGTIVPMLTWWVFSR